MEQKSDPRLVHRLSIFASAASLFSIVTGLSGIAGWIFHVPFFYTWGAAPVTMKVNTAACFVLVGVSLLLSQKKDNQSFPWAKKLVERLLASALGSLALLSLAENLTGLDFGIDQWLHAAQSTDSLRAGLMSPLTAGAFLLLAVAVLSIDWRTRRGQWPTQYLALSVGGIATFGILGFAFDPHIYASHLSLALPTAVTLIVLSLGLICARTKWGLGALLCSKSLGGSLARRLLPAAFIPAVVGWVRWKITAAEIFSDWSTVVLAVLITMSLLAGVIAWAAVAVDRNDTERRKVEAALHISEEQLDRLLNRVEEPPSETALRRKVTLGFVVAVLLTCLLGFLSWRNAEQAATDADTVAHTQEVIRALEATHRHLLDIETGARGFVLTGKEQFLEPFQAGKRAVGQDLDGLRLLTADNPSQQRRLQLLTLEVTNRLKLADELVAAGRKKDALSAGPVVEQGRQLMDTVRATIEQMEIAEKQLLDQRTQKTQTTRHLTTSIMVLGSILGVVFLVIAGFTVSRQIGDSARARAQVYALNVDLERRVAERTAALGESESRLAGVIQSAMDSIITVDDDQRIVLFNSAAEKMFRCPAAEAMGQPITRFIPQRFQAAHAGHISKFSETGITNRSMGQANALWAMRSNGEEFQIEASISQIEAGTKRLFTVILRDVTERKQTEAALRSNEEMLRLLLDGVKDYAVYMLDPDGRVVSWNAGAARIKGYSAEEIIGKNISVFYTAEQQADDVPAKALREAASKGRFEGEGQRVRKNGSIFWGHVVILPLYDEKGVLRGFSKVLHDITEHKRSETTLAEQAQVLDLAQILVRDIEGRIVQWSMGAERLYGFSRTEAVGQFSHKLLRTEFPAPLPQIEEILHNTGQWEGELVHQKRDGSRLVIASLWVLHRDAQGKPVRVLEANTDITARKQAEEQLAIQAEELSRQAEELTRSQQALQTQSLMLHSVLDSMAEGLVATDEQGKFIIWNPAAEKILGLNATNLPSQHWSEHYGLFLADTVTPFPSEQLPLVKAIRGESTTAQMFVRNPELEQGVWIEASAGPLKDLEGVIRGGVVAFRDITQKRSDEDEIHRLNQELEQRVVQRTAQLEETNKELEAFTYSVSHDLRAPLRHMAGFSGILLEEFGPTLAPEAQKYLHRIQEATVRMGRLVDELLTLARIGRQSANLQVAGLHSIVEEVVAMLAPDVEGRQVDWKIADLPFVECDPILMKQVFQNLLSNALKYSRPRAKAVIEVGQMEMHGQPVIFVRDNGVGFSMKYADKLFGVFQRLHRAEDFEGTGVGLATVLRIIKKHNGRIWAEAELDKGATFYFTLGPARPTEAKNVAMAGVGA